MPISIFLSRPTPHERCQERFLIAIEEHLAARGMQPRTIGATDYSRTPMPHIRSVMMDCNGLLGVAFRRFHIVEGEDRPGYTGEAHKHATVNDRWLTTPYLHLEAAIAFQIGLPILIMTEKGVIQEGALEAGVLSTYPLLFDSLTSASRTKFFSSANWNQLVNTWEGEVREVVHNKGQPPKLYHR